METSEVVETVADVIPQDAGVKTAVTVAVLIVSVVGVVAGARYLENRWTKKIAEKRLELESTQAE